MRKEEGRKKRRGGARKRRGKVKEKAEDGKNEQRKRERWKD